MTNQRYVCDVDNNDSLSVDTERDGVSISVVTADGESESVCLGPGKVRALVNFLTTTLDS